MTTSEAWHPLGPIDLQDGNKTLAPGWATPYLWATKTMSAHLRRGPEAASNDLCWAMEARRMLSEVGAIEYLFAEAEVRRAQASGPCPGQKTVKRKPICSLSSTKSVLDWIWRWGLC